MSHSHDDLPPDWCAQWTDLTKLTDDLYYGWPPDEHRADPGPNPWFWHWCQGPTWGRWIAQSTTEHTLVSREPLHMEPSLLWSCCGTHGWVRDNSWVPA